MHANIKLVDCQIAKPAKQSNLLQRHLEGLLHGELSRPPVTLPG